MYKNVYKEIKSNKSKTFALFHVFILQTYTLLVTFKGFPLFEIRKNLDLRKILSTPKIFLKSRFHCTIKFLQIFYMMTLQKHFFLKNMFHIVASRNTCYYSGNQKFCIIKFWDKISFCFAH